MVQDYWRRLTILSLQGVIFESVNQFHFPFSSERSYLPELLLLAATASTADLCQSLFCSPNKLFLEKTFFFSNLFDLEFD